jgi:hypothetical protein
VDLSNVTREQKEYVAIGALVLFIVFLFLPWFGSDGFDTSGWDLVPASWVLLIFAIAAILLLAADAFRFELPVRAPVGATAAYLASIPLIVTFMFLVDISGRKYGVVLSFIFALVAVIAAVILWREDR